MQEHCCCSDPPFDVATLNTGCMLTNSHFMLLFLSSALNSKIFVEDMFSTQENRHKRSNKAQKNHLIRLILQIIALNKYIAQIVNCLCTFHVAFIKTPTCSSTPTLPELHNTHRDRHSSLLSVLRKKHQNNSFC